MDKSENIMLTSASNVEEGDEVRIGGRWMVAENVVIEDDLVYIEVEEVCYSFALDYQLSIVKY